MNVHNYQTPDSRRGAYAGAPRDRDASPRRLVARLAHHTVLLLGHDDSHLHVVREVLQWAVDVPALVAELVVRRDRAGRSRADIARATGVSVSTVGNWESGMAIPHQQDWQAVCDAYCFTESELARMLDRCGPPERRGAPGPRAAAGLVGDGSLLVDPPPEDDGDVQARRVTDDAPRLDAHPVWYAALPGRAGIGGWHLDLPEADEDDGAGPRPRSRSGPSVPPGTVPPPGGVLGPVDLSALMHRQDWAMWLIETSRHLADRVDAHLTACASDGPADPLVPAALYRAGVDLAFAYQQALLLHADTRFADRLAASADQAVAVALSEVMIASLTTRGPGRRADHIG